MWGWNGHSRVVRIREDYALEIERQGSRPERPERAEGANWGERISESDGAMWVARMSGVGMGCCEREGLSGVDRVTCVWGGETAFPEYSGAKRCRVSELDLRMDGEQRAARAGAAISKANGPPGMGRCPDGEQVLARGCGVGCICRMLIGCLSRRLGRLRTGRRQGGGQFPSGFLAILSIGFSSPDMRYEIRSKKERRIREHLCVLGSVGPPPASRPLITRIPELGSCTSHSFPQNAHYLYASVPVVVHFPPL
jgi:hypothetical protein